MGRFGNFLRKRLYLVLSVAAGILIIIFSTAVAAHNTQPPEVEYHRYNKNHLREQRRDSKKDNKDQDHYRQKEEKHDYHEHHHKDVPKVDPPAPVPMPVPDPQPQPVPPIHIEPPIEIDPPLPLPGPPCGACGVINSIKTKGIACPMQINMSMICAL